ncbi:diacylglycerol kinase family protein [Rathayibacter sp. YIM 133350]|uniref:diacylglycerol/lipid kinase family protein n=1 Tax=Rathayibacter sp. YIM 133350 TaxID=3131992 RepID=UPI00307E82D8
MSAQPEVRRAAVVANPTKVDMQRLRIAVNSAAAAAGWGETIWLETTIEDPGHGIAAQAVEAGAAMVLAVGGDGTVRAVSATLRGSEIPLALVPQGTGNLLARNLRLPLGDLTAAVHIAFAGETRSVDVGVASVTTEHGEQEEHAFVVMAGIGIDADMIANADPQLKRRVGWLAYVDSGVRAIPKATRFRIRYRFDDPELHHAHISSILIGNCGVLPGNILLFPEARIDDGVLDIAMLQPKTLFGWLDIWRRVTWENRVLRRFSVGRRIIRLTDAARPTTMTTVQGAGITVDLADPRVFELDGDEVSVVRTLRAWVDPGSLFVRVPALAA